MWFFWEWLVKGQWSLCESSPNVLHNQPSFEHTSRSKTYNTSNTQYIWQLFWWFIVYQKYPLPNAFVNSYYVFVYISFKLVSFHIASQMFHLDKLRITYQKKRMLLSYALLILLGLIEGNPWKICWSLLIRKTTSTSVYEDSLATIQYNSKNIT